MKKQILFLLFFTSLFSAAQNPLVKMWDKRFGGSDGEQLFSFQQTRDGGYILAGQSPSNISGDKTQNSWGGNDYWIVKTDSLGIKQWDQDFGGDSMEYLFSIEQTNDGGYILGGYSSSDISGNKTQPKCGAGDYWILKTDSLGIKLWEKDFGGISGDRLSSVHQTMDGGYILGGWSGSDGGCDKTQPKWGSADYWIIKTDSMGNKQWDKDFGGVDNDLLYSIEQTSDAGYILAGYSTSGISGDKTQNNWGYIDYWILKTDSNGNKLWDKDFGGSSADQLYSMLQTSDGGYLLGGWSGSGINGDKTEPTWGSGDYWVIKTDSLGNKQWDKDYGGVGSEAIFGNIFQCTDGGFLISGNSQSQISGNKTENNLGQEQTWMLKTDSIGNVQWDKTIKTLGRSFQGLAIQAKDGCYVIANSDSSGIGGYKSQTSQGGYDFWVIKFCDSTLTTNIASTEKINNQLLLWPNPTKGELKINNTKLKIDLIEIFNALGERLRYETTNCESCIVNCEFFPPGIYFVKATTRDKVFFKKIIKQ